MKTLVVGLDETTISFLKSHGTSLESVTDLEDVEEFEGWVLSGNYNACIVDLDASSLGIFLARGLREKHMDIPVIGICRRPEEGSWSNHRAQFLENGGDDLLPGPVNPRELVATLRAVTRRFNGSLVDVVELTHGTATLRINRTTLRATVNGKTPRLTGKERLLLMVLAGAHGRTLTKEQILTDMYTGGVDDEPEQKIVDVFVCKLRKKLKEINDDAGVIVETVWGRGYRLIGDAKTAEAA
ncbi:MAG TPA: response regulator transcription factor [Candidatus Paceibacterota bacterium]|nr:response regulator transcription factor [Candidatus Paceibacterota bacterium]